MITDSYRSLRPGSIIPMGPAMEWSTEKPADPIELRIYPGTDGNFTFYEDENDNYDYVKGEHATVRLHWDDAAKIPTLGAREGSFTGMLAEHTFRIVLVGKDHGVGIDASPTADATVTYKGAQLSLHP